MTSNNPGQTHDSQSLDQLSIDTLRLLAVDEVEKANSGHPGAPLGCAPMAYLLFYKLMKHNPAHSKWADRDRFVLSNGHASALLYGTLFLSGYGVTLDDLKSFRQWGSRTPGHPERGHADGVEVTTGPLGQGIAMAVGMAIAEKHLAAVYNRPGFNVVDHYTFAMLGDGDLMEGVSHEAASLAGTLGLGKLIFLYDDNQISLDGPTSLSYTEDALERFAEQYVTGRTWPVSVRRFGGEAFPIGPGTVQIAVTARYPGLGNSIEAIYDRLGLLIATTLCANNSGYVQLN